MSRGRRKREEEPSQREKEVEFEQDRATQNYPVTLLCRNTTEGEGEPFAEGGRGGGGIPEGGGGGGQKTFLYARVP